MASANELEKEIVLLDGGRDVYCGDRRDHCLPAQKEETKTVRLTCV